MKKFHFTPLTVIVAAILISSCLLSSCKKDDPEPVPPSPPPVTTTISASIGGTIVDEAANPVDGATVTIGSKTASTNSFGAFLITGANVDPERAYIKVEKAGYFDGSRVIKASTTATSSIKIMLLSNSPVGSVDNSAGGTVTNTGASVVFSSNDVVSESRRCFSATICRIKTSTPSPVYHPPGLPFLSTVAGFLP